MRKVHRLATDAERRTYPNAYTFNRATGRFHNRAGFEIFADLEDGDRKSGRMTATEEAKGMSYRKAGRMPALPAKVLLAKVLPGREAERGA